MHVAFISSNEILISSDLRHTVGGFNIIFWLLWTAGELHATLSQLPSQVHSNLKKLHWEEKPELIVTRLNWLIIRKISLGNEKAVGDLSYFRPVTSLLS